MIRLALRVRRAEAELVLADLLELAPSGVEEIEFPEPNGGEGVVEYAVYGSRGELPDLPRLRAAVGGALVEISTSEIPDDWSERWKQFHRPVLVEPPAEGHLRKSVPALHVRPPWEGASVYPGACEIVIDPAQAFGTGAHATTRLCLTLLLELAASDASRAGVLDVGAGSGVLAIAAAQLGYRPVLALDNDRESVLASAANAAANDVDVQAQRLDLRYEALPDTDGKAASVILANLLKPLLHDLAEKIVCPPQHLIVSGLLSSEAGVLASAFAVRHGLRERRLLERGDWAALWLARD